VPDAELRELYASARALLLPGEEDFGMVPVEAQAAGTPVIAFDGGGARETVIDGVTGIRFRPQTVEGLSAGIERAARVVWDRDRIRQHAGGFNEPRFRHDVQSLIESFADRATAAAVTSGYGLHEKEAARPSSQSTISSPGGSHRS
jgi:glycosyltransferase involved in cell wall biosynthesis